MTNQNKQKEIEPMSGILIMYRMYLQCIIKVYNHLYKQLVCLPDEKNLKLFSAYQDES